MQQNELRSYNRIQNTNKSINIVAAKSNSVVMKYGVKIIQKKPI